MPKVNSQHLPNEWVIYALVSPNAKKIYIGHCLNASLWETYRHNLNRRRDSTIKLIEEISPDRPCLFILETVLCSNQEATNYIVVWTKIFIENGYESFNRKVIQEMSQDLFFDNRKLYEERKGKDLDEILSCQNCQMPIYKKQMCKDFPYTPDKVPKREHVQRTRENLIQIRVTPEERNAIEHHAHALNMQIAPYVRSVALNPTIVQYDYSIIAAHTSEITEIRDSINRLVFTIHNAPLILFYQNCFFFSIFPTHKPNIISQNGVFSHNCRLSAQMKHR